MNESGPVEGEQAVYEVSATYEAFVLSIVLLTLGNSFLIVFGTNLDVRHVALIINRTLSAFLVLDALQRIVRNRHQIRQWVFARGGWLMMLGSLPVPFAGTLRMIVYWLTYRAFKTADLEELGITIRAKRAQSTLLGIVLAAIIVFELSAIFILRAEDGSPGANIQNASDALWWGVVTVATVGYGDRYPVTTNGRLIGIATMIVGVALFSAITSFLADWFRRPHTNAPSRRLPARSVRPGAPASEPNNTIAAMRQSLDAYQQSQQIMLDELNARIDELERKLGDKS